MKNVKVVAKNILAENYIHDIQSIIEANESNMTLESIVRMLAESDDGYSTNDIKEAFKKYITEKLWFQEKSNLNI